MLLFQEKTELIIDCFYKVYNEPGYGFLEKVYENALAVERSNQGLQCKQQSAVKVFYKGTEVGIYYADIIVDDLVIIELKAGKNGIAVQHEMQLLNYLKATRLEVGLIFNFGESLSIKRRILTNDMK
ncbi:GxxExxY protein [soil metagenome]